MDDGARLTPTGRNRARALRAGYLSRERRRLACFSYAFRRLTLCVISLLRTRARRFDRSGVTTSKTLKA